MWMSTNEEEIEVESETQVENIEETISNEIDENKVTNDNDIKKEKNKDKDQEESSLFAILIDITKYLIIIIIATNLLTSFVIQRTIVSGWSMEDTLYEGDNLLVEKVSYKFSDLERFDIIAFYPYGKNEEEYYIKRIIALPGEHIKIMNDDIYIDGKLLEEDYGKTDLMGYLGIAEDGIQLGEGEYFVLGDNREESFDSRYVKVGPIKFDEIEGKALIRIWPLDKFGILD